MIEKIVAFAQNVRFYIVIGCLLPFSNLSQNSGPDLSTIKTVVIDAGHGGKDQDVMAHLPKKNMFVCQWH